MSKRMTRRSFTIFFMHVRQSGGGKVPLLKATARLLALSLAFGCGGRKAPRFAGYSLPGEALSLEVPANWQLEESGWSGRGGPAAPLPLTRFIAERSPQHEGELLGAHLILSRYDKPGLKGSTKLGADYERAVAHMASLFKDEKPGILSENVAGLPARGYWKHYRFTSSGFHGEKDIPMELAGTVIDAPGAYYVLEYRSNSEAFGRHLYGYEHARQTLRIGGAGNP